jgi:hypothetical protein
MHANKIEAKGSINFKLPAYKIKKAASVFFTLRHLSGNQPGKPL